ncbi:MAG TPA: hypothetical protein VN633_16645, partial [Bryobacteraceae bacterium]|nr:hypothetical protein [Bryobacteraceae bacterium]
FSSCAELASCALVSVVVAGTASEIMRNAASTAIMAGSSAFKANRQLLSNDSIGLIVYLIGT